MPELRKDPVVGRWVIIAQERGKRPSDWGQESPFVQNGPCPFCPGNEDKTPPAILSDPEHKKNEWQVRVVPNKYPALQIEGSLKKRGEGLYDLMNGIGAHEVIIESPDHNSEFADYSVYQIANILTVYKNRIVDLKNDVRLKHILIFKNHGRAAGASLKHSHSQLIATPILPKRVQEELEGARSHFQLKERCVFCDIIYQELADGKRIVAENDSFVCLAPFAARFPYELWILPRDHFSHFEHIDGEQLIELAALLKDALERLSIVLASPPYNFVIHSYPIQEKQALDYHWHIEIIPQLTKVAGFEWGSGFYINPVAPELSAMELRDAAKTAL